MTNVSQLIKLCDSIVEVFYSYSARLHRFYEELKTLKLLTVLFHSLKLFELPSMADDDQHLYFYEEEEDEEEELVVEDDDQTEEEEDYGEDNYVPPRRASSRNVARRVVFTEQEEEREGEGEAPIRQSNTVEEEEEEEDVERRRRGGEARGSSSPTARGHSDGGAEREGVCCPICMEPWSSGDNHQIRIRLARGREWLEALKGLVVDVIGKLIYSLTHHSTSHCSALSNEKRKKALRDPPDPTLETLNSLPCGHVYGLSCIEKWIRQCKKNNATCPQCGRKCKEKDIIKLYVSQISVADSDQQKKILSLQSENEFLKTKIADLNEKIDRKRVERMSRPEVDIVPLEVEQRPQSATWVADPLGQTQHGKDMTRDDRGYGFIGNGVEITTHGYLCDYDVFRRNSIFDLDRVVRGFVQAGLEDLRFASVGIEHNLRRDWRNHAAEKRNQRAYRGGVTRGDGGTPITDRESSCVGVRRTCADLRVIVSEAVTDYLRRSPIGGLRRLVPGRGAREEESGFRPSRYGERREVLCRGGRATKGSFDERRRGGHGSEQGRQHDVACSDAAVHEFYDSGSKAAGKSLRAAIVARAEGSKEDGFRKKEKKLKWDKKFDKGGKMSSKGGSLSAIYLARSRDEGALRDTVAGRITRMTKKVVPKRSGSRVRLTTFRAILGQRMLPLQVREEILLAAIQTESRHGNKKESDILMARQKTLFVGCKRFTNLSKLTCRRLLTSTRIQSGVKINVKHLVPYYGDTSDDDNSRANSVHPWENDEDELVVDGARVFDMDADGKILILARRLPGMGGTHLLTKISLMYPYDSENIPLAPSIKAVKDLRVSPCSGRLALFASLGKKLSVLSLESNNIVLSYDLPAPAWSCSWDNNSSYHIYAGLQNGMVLVFDMRQTAGPLESISGLTCRPVHTIHSLAHYPCLPSGVKTILTASAIGPCVWKTGGVGERPFLIPEVANEGVCISLAYCPSSNDIVASYRPQVRTAFDIVGSQLPLSQSPSVLGQGVRGSHVAIKRVNDGCYQKLGSTSANVNNVRMSKSAIVTLGNCNPLFAYGDEITHGLCLSEGPSLRVIQNLKPHELLSWM
ncbi:hypothetical protein Syun_016324 [Stephania yunnanensis]|uniref:RING-type domain-containing protein n=1 Tax=Stephania yunnanensis TaxID=152371 RepID=A0AAP0J4L7_9MAGN